MALTLILNSLSSSFFVLFFFFLSLFFISTEWLFIRECQSFYERKPSPTSWKLNPWKLSRWIWIGNQLRCWPPIPLHLICEERIMGWKLDSKQTWKVWAYGLEERLMERVSVWPEIWRGFKQLNRDSLHHDCSWSMREHVSCFLCYHENQSGS